MIIPGAFLFKSTRYGTAVDNFRVSFGHNIDMPLTPKQKQILDFIKTYTDKNGFSPTHIEIANKFKLVVSTVHEHLSALEKKGYIKKDRGHARTIETVNSSKSSGLVRIPLLGTISAGQPIEAVEVPEEIEIPKSDLSKSGKFFALKVTGDSQILFIFPLFPSQINYKKTAVRRFGVLFSRV